MTVSVLKHQLKYMEDEHRHLALVGGFGCGKSDALGFKTFKLMSMNQGYVGTIVARSGNQLYQLKQQIEIVWQRLGLTYLNLKDYRRMGEEMMVYTSYGDNIYWVRWPGGECEIKCYTTENNAYKRMAGLNAAWAVIDEIDTMPKADEIYAFVNDRIRVGNFNQVACASTPEGFGFLWDFFEQQPLNKPELNDDRNIIRGCSLDNPFISPDYIKNQIQTRDPRSMAAYVYGHFVNLDGALVYYRFDKDKNVTDYTLRDFSNEEYFAMVGVDFNKGINATTISIVSNNRIYVVDEIVGCNNVDALIKELNKKLMGWRIQIFPDASGFEAIQQLERAYGEGAVIYDKANPLIEYRVYSMNMKMVNENDQRQLFINPQTCPQTYNAVLRQVKDKNGKPAKDGLDHFCDALGYCVWQTFPANPKSPSISVISSN